MSANITENDKQQGLVKAWHGLTEVMPVIEIDNNWLTQWDVVPNTLSIVKPDGEKLDTKFKILTATDNGMVIGRPYASTYTPITNKTFLSLVQQVLDETEGAKIESIGSVCDRNRVFASISIKDAKTYSIGARTFNDYLNFGNSYDGTSALWVCNTNVCTVCNNTFTYNMGRTDADGINALGARITHSGNVDVKLTNIKGIITGYLKNQQLFREKFSKLDKMEISGKVAYNIFKAWSAYCSNGNITENTKLRTSKLNSLFHTGRGNSGKTRADLFSAVTDYYTHMSLVRSPSDTRQYVSSEFGTGAQKKREFWRIVNNDAEVEKWAKMGELIAA